MALATGFGLGLAPIASGTAGTVLGVAIFFAISRLGSMAAQIAVSLALAAVAVPICGTAERHFGRKDDGRIVADEYLTFPLCVLGLPFDPRMMAVAFVVNRILDIVKPPPARQLQRLSGGTGIVIDDAISCMYGLALNHGLFRLLFE